MKLEIFLKKENTSVEFILSFSDLPLLRYIQNQLVKSHKMGSKSYQYRLYKYKGIIQLINIINGLIRHSFQLLQLHRVCQEILIIYPCSLTKSSIWFGGF